jgi:hypothetical protein
MHCTDNAVVLWKSGIVHSSLFSGNIHVRKWSHLLQALSSHKELACFLQMTKVGVVMNESESACVYA